MSRSEILQMLKIYKTDNSIKYGINDIGIFGSVSRGDDTSESDIDIFIQTKNADPFIIVAIKEELESMFHKHVDIIRLRQNMNPFLKKRIEKEGIHV